MCVSDEKYSKSVTTNNQSMGISHVQLTTAKLPPKSCTAQTTTVQLRTTATKTIPQMAIVDDSTSSVEVKADTVNENSDVSVNMANGRLPAITTRRQHYLYPVAERNECKSAQSGECYVRSAVVSINNFLHFNIGDSNFSLGRE